MQESPELAALTQRMYAAQAAGEVEWLAGLVTSSDAALTIGSDAAEWWEGGERIRELWRAQIAAGLGDAQAELLRVRAFEEGDVGWVADEARLEMPGGSSVTMRTTTVFHREDGEWRLVHGHSSVGVPNEESVGMSLPT